MGYRSDVTLLMREDDFNTMVEELKGTSCEDYFDTIEETKYFKTLEDERRYVLIRWEWIKWYSEADTITNYLEERELYYEFLRIGEESNDIDIRQNVPDDEEWRLYVRREYDLDYSNFCEV